MWIHGGLFLGPKTLFPPTEEQYNNLASFLLAPPNQTSACPLPILGTYANRPRWDPYHALAYHHIFRDKYERILPPNPPPPGCVQSSKDWPEYADRQVLLMQHHAEADGTAYVTPDQVAAANADIKNMTPSSPLWHTYGKRPTLE